MKNTLKCALIGLILIFALMYNTQAQDFLPAVNDNFMGINQVTLQPAAIVDSRSKIDINLFGYSSDMFNNMFKFETIGLLSPYDLVNDEEWWDENHILASKNMDDKAAYVNIGVLGPSFMITINAKHAIGFTSRFRQILNAEGIGAPLAYSIYEDFEDQEYLNKWYHEENLREVQHLFADYGISYATEVYNKEKHYIKAGLTVKLLQGLGGAYVEAEDLYYYADNVGADNDTYVSWNSDYFEYGASDNFDWEEDDNGIGGSGLRYTFISDPSIGLDLGAVYEFRPKFKDFYYDMDGEKSLVRKDLNKYLVKVGISVLDIGRLRYKKAYGSQDAEITSTANYQSLYDNNSIDIPGNTHWMNLDDVSFGFPPYMDLADTINQRINTMDGWNASSKNDDKFTISLPTALSIQADVNVVKGFYLNLTTYTSLKSSYSKTGNSHYISTYSFTPRYEHKWFSVMLPMSYGGLQKFNVGLGLRAGFVYMGINNLFNSLFSEVYGTSFYFGVKVPIWYPKPPDDRDKDGVSDKKDNCIDDPGTWELLGCPDRDGDKVVDKDDKCPDIAGLIIFQGCPDTDGDGVPDYEDDCPNEPGDKLTKGCPDRDGDGVIDKRDECPDTPGPIELNGCPDRDGDGIPDIKDNCPDVAGPIEFGGCPFMDTDLDGVKDSEDDCPTVAGPPENRGCPYTDSDGDGVIDKDDKCPLTPGDPLNAGCPVIKAEEAAVLKTAFENLEFETGKAVIRSSSFPSLDELATLLISKPTWKLKISGHTDNVGSDASNLTLSKNRAESTAKYLQGKGVAPSQLMPEWFGETRPIADNGTPEGRQANRRVEMTVVFD